MISTNVFLQGIEAFTGQGLDTFAPLGDGQSHRVPDGVISQALYFRGGNSCDELIVVALLRDDTVMRYFPIDRKSVV